MEILNPVAPVKEVRLNWITQEILEYIKEIDHFLYLFKKHGNREDYMSRAMRKCVLCHMRTTKAQISLRIRAV